MKQALRQSLAICCIALIPAVGSLWFHLRHPGWDPNVLGEGEIFLSAIPALNQPVLWVDARSRSQYEREHVPQAVLLNEDEWSRQFAAVLDQWQPGRPLVVYCDSQACHASQQVAKRLRESGLSPVYVLRGGWKAWQNQKR